MQHRCFVHGTNQYIHIVPRAPRIVSPCALALSKVREVKAKRRLHILILRLTGVPRNNMSMWWALHKVFDSWCTVKRVNFALSTVIQIAANAHKQTHREFGCFLIGRLAKHLICCLPFLFYFRVLRSITLSLTSVDCLCCVKSYTHAINVHIN